MKGLLIVDPLNDFLNSKGVAWSVVEKSVKENKTIENLRAIINFANKKNMKIFVSPHCYSCQEDKNWKGGGFIENFMLTNKMFFTEFGCDIITELKEGLRGAIICSSHKIYGPQTTDLALQLSKNNIDEVFVAGMSANLCVESHIRHLLECGLRVQAIKDATAGASLPIGDGYAAALINFQYICASVITTEEFCKPSIGKDGQIDQVGKAGKVGRPKNRSRSKKKTKL